MSITSKAGRSRDVRRIYHRDIKWAERGPKPAMRLWANAIVTSVGDKPTDESALVLSWLRGKGVRL